MREKRAKNLRVDTAKIAKTRRTSEMRFQERQKLRDVTSIGLARCGALAAFIDEMRKPIFDRALEVATKRQLHIRCQDFVE